MNRSQKTIQKMNRMKDDEKKIESQEGVDEETQDDTADEVDIDAGEDTDVTDDEDLDAILDEDGGDDDESEDADEGDADADADEGEEDPKEDKNKSAIAQKKKWRERALAAEAKLKGEKPQQKPVKKANTSRDNALINFRLDHPTLKSTEVSEIEAYATVKGISLESALKSDVIRTMIAHNRKKQQHQGGSISPSRRGQPTKPEKDFSRAGREDMEKEMSRRIAAARQGK